MNRCFYSALHIWLIALSLTFSPIARSHDRSTGAAINLPDIHAAVPEGHVPVQYSVVQGASTQDVARAILAQDQDAKVFVPPEEASQLTGAANKIQVQKANTLNTFIISFDYVYSGTFYLVASDMSWLQAFAMIGVATAYLKFLTLKLGRWSRIMQIGGQKFSGAFQKLGFARSPKSVKGVDLLGNYMTHYALCYLSYGLMQFATYLPDIQQGFFGGEAQINILRKAAMGFSSGFGWTMLARKWDGMEDSNRPISRQAYASFNLLRSVTLAMFLPLVLTTSNEASLSAFLLRSAPLVISAITGATIYLWTDPILKKFPSIVSSMQRFENIMQRLDQKLSDRFRSCGYSLSK